MFGSLNHISRTVAGSNNRFPASHNDQLGT
ncbi:MAG: hypothetical protein V7646_4374 [Pseudonocardia sp.]|jgi:hypothetical protein